MVIIITKVVSLIALLQLVFGATRHEYFLNADWTFIGNEDRSCASELNCSGSIPACDSLTNGKTVQDREELNGCIAQGCESASQYTYPTYYCSSARKEEFLNKGWSFVGNVDRLCTSPLGELNCTGSVPACDSSTNGKTVQDRDQHNGCIAQGCESGSQYTYLTYVCEVITTTSPPTTTTTPNDRCDRLDIDGYLTECSTTIDTMSAAITTNKAEFDSFKVDVNIALEEIADFNAAHAVIGRNIDDVNDYTSISFKDGVIFAMLLFNFVAVIYVFCALKAQNKKLKGGYSVTYAADA